MSREQIVRDTAYAIWEAEGKPEGRDAQHWSLAEERVAASTGQPTKPATPIKGEAASPASDTPKATKPVKKAATESAPAKSVAKPAASKPVSKPRR